jgi:hypothetical protein
LLIRPGEELRQATSRGTADLDKGTGGPLRVQDSDTVTMPTAKINTNPTADSHRYAYHGPVGILRDG